MVKLERARFALLSQPRKVRTTGRGQKTRERTVQLERQPSHVDRSKGASWRRYCEIVQVSAQPAETHVCKRQSRKNMKDPIQTKRTQLLRRALVWIGCGEGWSTSYHVLTGTAAPPKGGRGRQHHQKKEGHATKWRTPPPPTRKREGSFPLLLGSAAFSHLLRMVQLFPLLLWMELLSSLPLPSLGGAVFPSVS